MSECCEALPHTSWSPAVASCSSLSSLAAAALLPVNITRERGLVSAVAAASRLTRTERGSEAETVSLVPATANVETGSVSESSS